MIDLPEGFVFAEVVGNLGAYCVERVDGEDTNARIPVTLCGALVHERVPEGWGPEAWSEVHRDCVRVLAGFQRCPVCWLPVEAPDGRVGPHGLCAGVNMRVAG